MRSFINFIDFFGVFFNVLFLIGFLLMLIGFCLVISESSVHGILYLMIAFVLLTEIAILCKMEFILNHLKWNSAAPLKVLFRTLQNRTVSGDQDKWTWQKLIQQSENAS